MSEVNDVWESTVRITDDGSLKETPSEMQVAISILSKVFEEYVKSRHGPPHSGDE